MTLPDNNIAHKYTAEETARFDKQNPSHIGTVGGIRFFEHPELGDENPLIVKHNGQWVDTVFWDCPDIDDLFYVGALGQDPTGEYDGEDA